MSGVYWDEEELIALFGEHSCTTHAHEVDQDKLRDNYVHCKNCVYDDESVRIETLRDAVRECVKSFATKMPEVAQYAEIPELDDDLLYLSGVRSQRINALVPFRITIAYHLGLPTGETYIDDEGMEQLCNKSGHMVVADTFVSG